MPRKPRTGRQECVQLALDEALQSLDAGLPNICLVGRALGPDAAVELANALESNTTVRLLEVEGGNIQDDGATALAKVLCVNNVLKMLDLSNNGIGDKGACKLAEGLDKNACLEQLDLVTNQVRSSGGTRLAKAIRQNQSIRQISLAGNRVGYKGAKAFAEALEVNRSLKILNLAGNAASDAGASALAKALMMPGSALVELDLSNNNITDSGAADLADMLKGNSALTELLLDCNTIRDRGGQALADALGVNRTLQTLWLVKNPLGSSAVGRLSQVLQVNPTIRRLGMSTTARIRPESVRDMEAIQQNRLKAAGLAEVAAAAAATASPRGVTLQQLEEWEMKGVKDVNPASLDTFDAVALRAALEKDAQQRHLRHMEAASGIWQTRHAAGSGKAEEVAALSAPRRWRLPARVATSAGAPANSDSTSPGDPDVDRLWVQRSTGDSTSPVDPEVHPDLQEAVPPPADILAEIQFLDDQLLFLDVSQLEAMPSASAARIGMEAAPQRLNL